jgi:hypothetical protein
VGLGRLELRTRGVGKQPAILDGAYHHFSLTVDVNPHRLKWLQVFLPEVSRISCRVAEGYGPDEATATGSGKA